jgi:hypothetical protein
MLNIILICVLDRDVRCDWFFLGTILLKYKHKNLHVFLLFFLCGSHKKKFNHTFEKIKFKKIIFYYWLC